MLALTPADVAEVHWSIPVICHHRRRKKARELEAAVAVRRAHHGNLDALVAQSSDTSRPFSFDHGSPFELEAELEKEINRRCEVVDDNAYVVHPFKRHGCTLQDRRLLLPTTIGALKTSRAFQWRAP